MAGHNKWSKIKRQKAVTDARRSKVWARLTRDMMVAAKDGGGDPETNARLALAVQKAKAENMPKENIERAIKKGTGEIAGADYEELTYEGYALGGVAVFVETLTDNSNRTVADLRHLFSKHGAGLGNSGSVAFMFDRKAVFEIPVAGIEEEALFLLVAEAGAEDLSADADTFMVTAPVSAFNDVSTALHGAGIVTEEASLQRIPTTLTAVAPEIAPKVIKLLELVEELDDVQAVYSTLKLDDATLQALDV